MLTMDNLEYTSAMSEFTEDSEEQHVTEETVENGDQNGAAPSSFKQKLAMQLYDLTDVFISAIIMIMVVFTFVFRFVGVVGTSMVDTLQDDDWLAVTATLNNVSRGDIVVVTQPNAFDEPIIKRVIALSGETIDLDIENQLVYIDGVALEEDYTSSPLKLEDLSFPMTVPEGCVFVMGDNRSGSTDSRSAMVGMIDKDYILGKVMFRIFPFGNAKVD